MIRDGSCPSSYFQVLPQKSSLGLPWAWAILQVSGSELSKMGLGLGLGPDPLLNMIQISIPYIPNPVIMATVTIMLFVKNLPKICSNFFF